MTSRAGAVPGLRVTIAPPVSESDYRFLYELALAGDTAYRWILRNHVVAPPFEAFVDALAHNVFAQFIAFDNATGEPICHLIAYQIDLNNRHGSVGLAATPSALGTGRALEALYIFLVWLFEMSDLRKIYAEAIEYNYSQFGSGEGRYFEREGCLSEHEYRFGRYWDVNLLAFERRNFLAATARFRDLVVAPRPPIPS